MDGKYRMHKFIFSVGYLNRQCCKNVQNHKFKKRKIIIKKQNFPRVLMLALFYCQMRVSISTKLECTHALFVLVLLFGNTCLNRGGKRSVCFKQWRPP